MVEIREPKFKPGDKVLVDTIKGKMVYEVSKAESYDFTYDEYCYELKNYDGEYTGEDESDLELYVKKDGNTYNGW